MNHYVYEITNLVNGKKYIGKRSCKCPIEKDKYMGSGMAIISAIKKYGIENFKKEVLQVCNDEDEAYELEVKYIENVKAYSDRKYYNIAHGGKGFRSEHISNINIERWKNADYKEKVSNSIKLAWANPLVREKIKVSLKSSWTEERKQAMSEYMKENTYWKGKKMPKHILDRMSKSQRGRKHSEQTKLKISRSNTGKILPRREECKNSKKVVCINTGEVFNCIRSIEDKFGFSENHISQCCRGNRKSEGVINGERCGWMYYDDYKKISKKDLDILIKELSENKSHKKVVCINTGEVFNTVTEASLKYNIPIQNISSCCTQKGNKTAGKLGEYKLSWRYYEDYLEMDEKEILSLKSLKVYNKIICINTLEVFNTAIDAKNKYAISNKSIYSCCRGRLKSAGKINGESARWMYYDDYLKQQEGIKVKQIKE